MTEEIEKLIKIQGIINREKYHLHINTDLEQKADWILYLKQNSFEEYMRPDNTSIMKSKIDTIEDLINYLEKHNGFERRF